jgi:hypothetical protein
MCYFAKDFLVLVLLPALLAKALHESKFAYDSLLLTLFDFLLALVAFHLGPLSPTGPGYQTWVGYAKPRSIVSD